MPQASPEEEPIHLESLLRSEERYRAFIRNTSEAIWRFELDNPISTALPPDEQVRLLFERAWLAECNDAMARMYGFSTPGEIVGARLFDLMSRGDPERISYIMSFVTSDYRLVDVESCERDRDGSSKVFLNNLTGVLEGDALVRVWGTQRDITAQKMAAAEARRQEEETQRALKQFAQMEQRLTLLTTASGRLLSTLDRALLTHAIVELGVQLVHGTDAAAVWRLGDSGWSVNAHYGLSNEFVRKSLSIAPSATPVSFDEPFVVDDLFTDPRTESRRTIYHAEGLQSMLVAPLRIGNTDSGSVVFYARKRGCFDEVDVRVAGALANIAASALHIADLYAARTVAESQAHFLAHAGTLLASSLDVESTLRQIAALAVPHLADWCTVHLVRDDGSLEPLAAVHGNPEKVRLAESLNTQYPPDSKGGIGIAEVVRLRRSQLVEQITDEMLDLGSRSAEHLTLLRQLELLSVLMVPMTRGDRAMGVITLATTSESERRLGQRELDLAEALASRATLALENSRLYREAQEANRLKDQFLATLSHELRTPLNAVLGWSRMLGNGMLDEHLTARALQAIQRNTQAQAQIVGDILELSRIISGKTDLVMEPVDLEALLIDLIESLRPTFGAASIEVSSSLEKCLNLEADRGRLQQIILNLLSNAAKFTPSGGKVTITASGDRDHVVVRVEDTGVGIASDFLPHVFDRFRQAEPSTSRTYGGLGIGLAVCRHLVDLHGGTITAASPGPGLGATFVARFPRASTVIR